MLSVRRESRFSYALKSAAFYNWLKRFPEAEQRQLLSICQDAIAERRMHYTVFTSSLKESVHRPHVRKAIQLGKTNPLVSHVVRIIVRLIKRNQDIPFLALGNALKQLEADLS